MIWVLGAGNSGSLNSSRRQSRVRSFMSSLSGIFTWGRSWRRRSTTTDDLPVQQQQQQQRGIPNRRASAPPRRTHAKNCTKNIKCKKTDTNVILVSMKDLDQMDNVATGDPVYCDKCKVVLSCVSDTKQDGDKLLWKW